ncbi:MAG: hypothetical protein M3164_04780 [Actinomycetota bacterium]|nr:hypothetical protein [Actinomycetota bacterium]
MGWQWDDLQGAFPVRVRARFSMVAVLTGLMVALGALALTTIVAVEAVRRLGYDIHSVVRGEQFPISTVTGAAMAVAAFFCYAWGGYTAGRMGRGAGLLHGIFVPLTSILAAAVFGYIAVGVLDVGTVDLPFGVGVLPLDGNLNALGFGVAAAVTLAILAGGALGGVTGERWHAKLEGVLPASYEAGHSGREAFDDLKDERPSYEKNEAQRPLA